MAKIILDLTQRVEDALCGAWEYKEEVRNPDGTSSPNPITKSEFVEAHIAKYIKDAAVRYEGEQAANTAKMTAMDTAEAEITITS